MPCDGSAPSGNRLSSGSTGFGTRLISLWVAKSTTANPLNDDNCAKIHLVEPSGFHQNVIGRMPASSSTNQAVSKVLASITLIDFPAMDPATQYLPSGVT